MLLIVKSVKSLVGEGGRINSTLKGKDPLPFEKYKFSTTILFSDHILWYRQTILSVKCKLFILPIFVEQKRNEWPWQYKQHFCLKSWKLNNI